MKKILTVLSALILASPLAFAGETVQVEVLKFGQRGYKVIKVLDAESNLKNVYTSACKARNGFAHVSLNDDNQGFMRLNGVVCNIVGVDRLAPGEKREVPDKIPGRVYDKPPTIINAPSTGIQFQNNVR